MRGVISPEVGSVNWRESAVVAVCVARIFVVAELQVASISLVRRLTLVNLMPPAT